MKTLRTTLFAGAVGLLSFVACSHNSSSDRGTTPAPALESSSQSGAPAITPANPAPAADDTGNTTSPINAPVNDPSLQTSPTGQRMGDPSNPISPATPSGGLPPTTTPRNDDTLGSPSPQGTDDTTGQPKNTPPTGTTTDDTTPPSAQPQTGKLDAGVPPAGTPARDAGTGGGTNKKMDAGTKMNPK